LNSGTAVVFDRRSSLFNPASKGSELPAAQWTVAWPAQTPDGVFTCFLG
jgi:hypothetical protein